jgi:biotin synthase-like enzyme
VPSLYHASIYIHTHHVALLQNAIFTGEQMLTTPCSGWDEDKSMLDRWGMRGLRSFEDGEADAQAYVNTKTGKATPVTENEATL